MRFSPRKAFAVLAGVLLAGLCVAKSPVGQGVAGGDIAEMTPSGRWDSIANGDVQYSNGVPVMRGFEMNLCFVPDFVGLCRVESVEFSTDPKVFDAPFTVVDMRVLYSVKAPRSGPVTGQNVRFLWPGGEDRGGQRVDVSGYPPIRVGDLHLSFLIFSHGFQNYSYPMVIHDLDLTTLGFEAAAPSVDLTAAFELLCAAHADGIYPSDLRERDFLYSSMRTLGMSGKADRVGAPANPQK